MSGPTGDREKWEQIREQLADEMEPPRRRGWWPPGPLAIGLGCMWILSMFFSFVGVFGEGGRADAYVTAGAVGLLLTLGVSTLSFSMRPPTIVMQPTMVMRRRDDE